MTKQYHIRNWKQYNQSLVKRGSLTVWIDDNIQDKWYSTNNQSTQKGRPKVYSDSAVEVILTLKTVYQMPYRGVIGLMKSILRMTNLALELPPYTTISRRANKLPVFLKPQAFQGPLHIAVDSTGLKVYGEGEWKVRQHGYTKRRTWRKLHLAVNSKNNQIESAIVSTNDFKDSELLEPLVRGIKKPIKALCGDGAYDSHEVYELLNDLHITPLIPPRKDAVVSKNNSPRDQVVQAINQKGCQAWKAESEYHCRSLAETAMFRLKTIFGDKLACRTFESQATEALIRCRALNKISILGMPESYLIS